VRGDIIPRFSFFLLNDSFRQFQVFVVAIYTLVFIRVGGKWFGRSTEIMYNIPGYGSLKEWMVMPEYNAD
jgi:hypothetical protein